MNEQNIWENFNLSEDNLKTSYDYLSSQIDNFKNVSKGELIMDIEVNNLKSGDEKKREMNLYILFIVAPRLGNFRKKILHIAEFHDQGRFPVNLWNYIEETSIKDISEEDLLEVLKNVLSTPKIKAVIENLFRQSLETKKNS